MPTLVTTSTQFTPQVIYPLAIAVGCPASYASVDGAGNVFVSTAANAAQSQAFTNAVLAYDPTVTRDLPSPRAVIQTALADPAVPNVIALYLGVMAESMMSARARKQWGG